MAKITLTIEDTADGRFTFRFKPRLDQMGSKIKREGRGFTAAEQTAIFLANAMTIRSEYLDEQDKREAPTIILRSSHEI